MAGCREAPTLEPPDVRWGQDVCARCSMILSDEAYAGAVVWVEDGERRVALYDDVGEMIESGVVPASEGGVKRWVKDASTLAWVEAAAAYYVRSADLHTPMGFGVAAFGDAAAAAARAGELGVGVLDWAGVQAALSRSAAARDDGFEEGLGP